MATIGKWKQRIVEFFVLHKNSKVYRISNETTLYNHFAGNFEINAQKAFEELRATEIVMQIEIGRKMYYKINFDKSAAIKAIIEFDETGEKMRPTSEETVGLREEFMQQSNNRARNRSFYYYYTEKRNPGYWVVLIRTKPTTRPEKIRLGSIDDDKSRIMGIWRAICNIRKCDNGFFVKKWVEDDNQRVCGNNRRPSKAAFAIFVRMGWLESVGERSIRYRIVRGTKNHKNSPD